MHILILMSKKKDNYNTNTYIFLITDLYMILYIILKIITSIQL